MNIRNIEKLLDPLVLQLTEVLHCEVLNYFSMFYALTAVTIDQFLQCVLYLNFTTNIEVKFLSLIYLHLFQDLKMLDLLPTVHTSEDRPTAHVHPTLRRTRS